MRQTRHVPTGVDLKIGTRPNLHIDEVRITKGVARYGAKAFTPPTAAFFEGTPTAAQRPVVVIAGGSGAEMCRYMQS